MRCRNLLRGTLGMRGSEDTEDLTTLLHFAEHNAGNALKTVSTIVSPISRTSYGNFHFSLRLLYKSIRRSRGVDV